MKPSRFRAMPVDEFDYEVSVDSFDPEAKNGFIFGWGVCDVSTDEGVCFMRSDGVGLGFMAEPPEGYYLEIVPRSSTGLKTNLRQPNSIGVIDSDYRGEVKAMYESKIEERKVAHSGTVFSAPVYKCVGTATLIKAGDRIAQMKLCKKYDAELVEVDELSETERGTGGFGSTGTR